MSRLVQVCKIFHYMDDILKIFIIIYGASQIHSLILGCGGHISGISGSVSSPQYPLKDNRNHDCKWVIAVALGKIDILTSKTCKKNTLFF